MKNNKKAVNLQNYIALIAVCLLNSIYCQTAHIINSSDYKKGLINSDKDTLLPLIFDEINLIQSFDIAFTTSGELKGLYSTKNSKWLFEPMIATYEIVSVTPENLFISVDRISLKSTQLFKVSRITSEVNSIDNLKNVLLSKFNDSICILTKGSNQQLFNFHSEKITSAKFDQINPIQLTSSLKVLTQIPQTNKKYLSVNNGAKCGLISLSGEEFIKCEFDSIQWTSPFSISKPNFESGYFLSWKNGIVQLFSSTTGNLIHSNITSFNQHGEYSVITNQEGKLSVLYEDEIILPFSFENITVFNLLNKPGEMDLIALAQTSSSTKFYALTNNEIKLLTEMDVKLKLVASHLGIMILTDSSNHYGAYNKKFEIAYPFIYDFMGFCSAKGFEKPIVAKKDSTFFFLSEGNSFFEIISDSITQLTVSSFLSINDNKVQIFDYNKGLIIDEYFDDVRVIMGAVTYRKGNHFGIIDSNGLKIGQEVVQENTGFNNLDEILVGLEKALKGTDDDLMIFCKLLTPNYWTIFEMRSNSVDYRKLVQNWTPDVYGKMTESYFSQMKAIRDNKIKRKGDISELKCIKFESTYLRIIIKEIEGTESWIQLQINDKLFTIKLGELLLIDNKFKVFTLPKS